MARAEQWGAALAAFEKAAEARDAPIVQFNIAYCQRALGRYVAARETTKRVLADPSGLPSAQLQDAKAYAREFEKLLVRLEVTLEPTSALLSVDGRPLRATGTGKKVFLASLEPPGKGRAVGQRVFTMVLDPGLHLFRATRPGHQDAVIRKSYRPGQRAKLDLRLDVLPATVSVKSVPTGAIVRVDEREVGLAPIEVQRPAGRYQLEVALDDYDTYTATLNLRAGQRSDLTAELVPYEEPITKKWWFWTTIAAVVAGGVIVTYVATRPDPEPPPYDGGNTGWVVFPQAIRF